MFSMRVQGYILVKGGVEVSGTGSGCWFRFGFMFMSKFSVRFHIQCDGSG